MTTDAVPINITPLQSVQARCELLAEMLREKKAGRTQHVPGLDEGLGSRRAFREHATFLEKLPRTDHYIDHDLCEAAVWHVCRSIRELARWDGGRQAKAAWEPIKIEMIRAFGLQDKHAWAAVYRHQARATGLRCPRKEMFEKQLPEHADLYLRGVLMHVTGADNH